MAVLAFLLGFVAIGCGAAPPPPSKKRIVLLTLDTLRWDSFFEAEADGGRMPRTRARAEDGGLLYQNFYSASNVTQPSHAAILSGEQPWKLGVLKNGMILPEKAETVAERMGASGWSTAAVVASFPLSRRFGFAQGFDAFVEAFSRGGRHNRTWEGHRIPESGFFGPADEVTDRAIGLLDQMEQDRQFLWVHYFDPHAPYGDSTDSPGPSIKSVLTKVSRGDTIDDDLLRMRKGYDEDVSFLDAQLDRLFVRLQAESENFDTWVIGVSDHGESLGEGGSLGHGKRLSIEQVHVPLFMFRMGHSVETGRGAVGRAATSVDIAATILALAGLNVQTAGENLLDGNPPISRRIFGMRRVFRSGAVELRIDGKEYPIGRPLFYCLSRKGSLILGNSDGVINPQKGLGIEEVAKLRKKFSELEDSVNARNQGSGELDQDARRGLEALGYIDAKLTGSESP